MPNTSTLNIRLPIPMRRAADKQAAALGVSTGVYVRGLIAEATGVGAAELPQGFAAMGKRKRTAAAKKGGRARTK